MAYFFFQWFIRITGYLPQLLVFRLKFFYEDRARQGRVLPRGAVLVANHRSVIDFGVLLFTFPNRCLRVAAAELLYKKNFFMTATLKLSGCVRVEREQFDFSFLEPLRSAVERGQTAVIFPEARIPDPWEERPLPFKDSYVRLALETGAPIVPVYHDGNAFSFARAVVVIGAPIDARALYRDDLSEKENVAQINQLVRSKIIELGKDHSA